MGHSKAFGIPIQENYARILLRIFSIECEVENNAPDFVSVETDEICLKVELTGSSSITIPVFEREYPVSFKSENKSKGTMNFEVSGEGIWFDIPIEQIKDIWVADLSFKFINKNLRYISYNIQSLDHQFEWLQPDLKTGEIKTMSISKKKYKPQKSAAKEIYSSVEVIRCIDMIGRAVRKIDLRTRGAYVKFNTDKDNLEPLIIAMGEKLGYKIEALSSEEVFSMEVSGNNVSHSIFLI